MSKSTLNCEFLFDKTSESEQQKLDEIEVTGGVSIFAPKS